MTLGEVLKDLRTSRGLTQDEFGALIGEHRTTVAYRESGRQGIPIRDLQQIATKLGRALVVTEDGWEVLDRHRYNTVQTAIKAYGLAAFPNHPHHADVVLEFDDEVLPEAVAEVLGQASAGAGSVNDHSAEREWLRLKDWLGAIQGLVRVHGESMVPLLHDGDLVGLRSAERQRVGDLVVAELVETNEVLVKLWAGARRGTICLNSINPEHGPVLLGQHEVVIRGLAWGLWRGGQLRV